MQALGQLAHAAWSANTARKKVHINWQGRDHRAHCQQWEKKQRNTINHLGYYSIDPSYHTVCLLVWSGLVRLLARLFVWLSAVVCVAGSPLLRFLGQRCDERRFLLQHYLDPKDNAQTPGSPQRQNKLNESC